jgi:hypothetical protein
VREAPLIEKVSNEHERNWARQTLGLCYRPEDIAPMLDAAARMTIAGQLTLTESVWAVCAPILRSQAGRRE